MSARGSCRRLSLLLIAVLTGALLVVTATPAAARVRPLDWHRFSFFDPSHERLRCLTDGVWRCTYDHHPEPTLGFVVTPYRATFHGTEVTGAWDCPELLGDVCATVVSVVAGTESFYSPNGKLTPFRVQVDLVVTENGTLWVSWVSSPDFDFTPFACPWYPTFEQALAANPAGAVDCPGLT